MGAGLRLRGADHDHAVHRLAEIAGSLLDDLSLERVPERGLAAGDELTPEIAAEIAELLVPDVAGELLARLQSRLDRVETKRHRDRAHPRDAPTRVVVDRRLHEVQRLLIDGADDDHGDALPDKTFLREHRIRALDELLRCLLPALEVLRVRARGVDLLLEVVDSAVEPVALGIVDEPAARDPDTDQDPHHEHQEHRRERGDVVAEVEHGCSA